MGKVSESAKCYIAYKTAPTFNGNYCSAGYQPSAQYPGTDNSWYNTQDGSTCPCTCYPDSVNYPTHYKSQRNCGADCLDTMK